MRKIDHMAIKDILRKRQIRTANNSLHQLNVSEPTLILNSKQISVESVIQKILRNESKHVHRCELTLEEKYAIIQLISERQNISYNRNTLAAVMTVWRCPEVCYFDNSKDAKNDHHLQVIFGHKSIKNIFVIYGQVAIFDKNLIQKQKGNKQLIQQTQQLTFQTQSKPQTLSSLLEGQEPKLVVEENFGWGPLFKKKQQQQLQKQKNSNVILKMTNTIFIQVKPPELESMLINLGGMDQEKKYKIIEHFPVFSSISKKIQSILPYIELKKYSKNDSIYKAKQNPEAIYLILKGEIIFEVKVQLPRNKKNANAKGLPTQFVMQTEALGIGNYFGEEQIIFKSQRNVSTICNSAQCDLLQIPIQKFQKLLTYSDFYQQLKTSAEVKIAKRKQKIEKAMQIYLQFNKSPQKITDDHEMQQRRNVTVEGKKYAIKKKSVQPVKVMHGNIIRKIPSSGHSQTISFSMLGANPDMYEATLKKFRKYTMKAPEKYKPDVNWNLKRVWKVLNLQSILREDAEVTSPQGRKFYQSHRRLQNHVQQVKSLRPKTSSSTYRTKLQYIAYLQQFNN